MSTTFTHDSPSVTEQTTSNTRLDFQHHSIKLLDFKQSPYTVTQTWNFTGLLSDMDNSPNVNQYFLCHSNFISKIYFCLSGFFITYSSKIVRKFSHVLWKNYIKKDIEDLYRSQRDTFFRSICTLLLKHLNHKSATLIQLNMFLMKDAKCYYISV